MAACLVAGITACGNKEEATARAEVTEAPATEPYPQVRQTAPTPIVPEGRTKETVSEWSATIKSELAAIAEFVARKTAVPAPAPSLTGTVQTFDEAQRQTATIHQSPQLKITQHAVSDQTLVPSEPDAFVNQLRQLLSLENASPKNKLKFKLFSINRDAENLTTRHRVTAKGIVQGHEVRSSAVVDATWRIVTSETNGEQAQLAAWRMPDVVRQTLTGDKGVKFEDVATQVLSVNPAWEEQLQFGMNTWRRLIDRSLNPDFLGYHGIAVRDVNGDGREDLYVCQPGGLPNLLFQQQPDGTLIDTSAESGVDWLDNSTGALLVDLDNDGDADLAVATRSAFVVMENNGQGQFTLASRMDTLGQGYSPTAADYDLDGDLDILVLRYTADGKIGDFPTPHPFHSARNGGANVLLQNQGGLRFLDVTDQSGLGTENYRFSFAASWEDYDNDGDSDLYIANDFGPNQLFRNEGGRFQDQSTGSAAQDWGFGMSATSADYDRDGDMDLYVSSMFSGAGNQVVAQADFNANMPPETRAKYLKMVRGNSLLQNGGTGQFADVTTPMNEGFGGWAWGAKFADFNNDGWEDLYVANGYISQPDTDDL